MSRLEWGLLAAAGLLLVLDALIRVLPASPDARANKGYAYAAPSTVVVDAPPADLALGGFSIFGVSSASLAAEKAQQQTGKAEALFKDGRRLRLEGLFTRGDERFGVIVNDDGRGRELKRETVGLGEALFGFRVVAFGHLSLMLQHPEQDEPLELLMFKPKSK